MTYIVEITAKTGLVIGGVKGYRSSPFKTETEARDFMTQALETNPNATARIETRCAGCNKRFYIENHGQSACSTYCVRAYVTRKR